MPLFRKPAPGAGAKPVPKDFRRHPRRNVAYANPPYAATIGGVRARVLDLSVGGFAAVIREKDAPISGVVEIFRGSEIQSRGLATLCWCRDGRAGYKFAQDVRHDAGERDAAPWRAKPGENGGVSAVDLRNRLLKR